MKNHIVLFYSNTGSNQFLAERIAGKLHCDKETIRPKINAQPLLMLLASLGLRPGIKTVKSDLTLYKSVVLVGPVWMGQLISPLRDFLRKHKSEISCLYFVSCCGSSDAVKDEKFGHGHVFRKVKEILGDKCCHCEAFPIGLILPEDQQKNSEAIMNTRLNSGTINEQVEERLEKLILKIKEKEAVT